jgi:hypothetical protein
VIVYWWNRTLNRRRDVADERPFLLFASCCFRAGLLPYFAFVYVDFNPAFQKYEIDLPLLRPDVLIS